MVAAAMFQDMAEHVASDPVLAALRARGAPVRQVRYRQNRSVLLSVSRDRRTLNSHECFRRAPPAVLEAVAAFVVSRPGSPEHRLALELIRGWEGARRAIEQVRRRLPPRRPPSGAVDQVGRLERLYRALNCECFGERLPRVTLRVSRRMTRSLGLISYTQSGGDRAVREIVIATHLLLPGNEQVLRDTLLHEMAHAEAWLEHGHRGHGPVWRRIAVRVGCSPRARTEARVRR